MLPPNVQVYCRPPTSNNHVDLAALVLLDGVANITASRFTENSGRSSPALYLFASNVTYGSICHLKCPNAPRCHLPPCTIVTPVCAIRYLMTTTPVRPVACSLPVKDLQSPSCTRTSIPTTHLYSSATRSHIWIVAPLSITAENAASL